MNGGEFEAFMEDGGERPFSYRATSSAVLVGAAIGWACVTVACCLAASVSLDLGDGDDRWLARSDDL